MEISSSLGHFDTCSKLLHEVEGPSHRELFTEAKAQVVSSAGREGSFCDVSVCFHVLTEA